MPSDQAAEGGSRAPRGQTTERVLTLLTDALEIIDALKLSPEIGARLEEVILAIEDRGKD